MTVPNATTFIIEQVLNGWNGSVAGDLIETVVVTQTKHGPFKSDDADADRQPPPPRLSF